MRFPRWERAERTPGTDIYRMFAEHDVVIAYRNILLAMFPTLEGELRFYTTYRYDDRFWWYNADPDHLYDSGPESRWVSYDPVWVDALADVFSCGLVDMAELSGEHEGAGWDSDYPKHVKVLPVTQLYLKALGERNGEPHLLAAGENAYRYTRGCGLKPPWRLSSPRQRLRWWEQARDELGVTALLETEKAGVPHEDIVTISEIRASISHLKEVREKMRDGC